MNPAITAIITLLLPAIPSLIAVAQVLIIGGPNKMNAVLEAIRAMLSHADPHPMAPDMPAADVLTDDQLRIIVETILAEQKRTGSIIKPLSNALATAATQTQTVTVPSPMPMAIVEITT